MDRPELRASDSDREAAERALRHHHLAGRLTVDELEDRLDPAHHAVTIGDLARLQSDRPPPPRPARPPPRPRGGRGAEPRGPRASRRSPGASSGPPTSRPPATRRWA